jgi:hypothetical protein
MRLPVTIGTGLGSSGIAPSTPVLAVSSSGTTVTATITGSDTGVTNYLKYRLVSDTAWQAGGSRSGNGTISVASLSYNAVYVFVVYSIAASGAVSLPSLAKMVTLAATVDNTYDKALIKTSEAYVRKFGTTVKYLPLGGDERSIKAVVTRSQYQDIDGMRSANAPVFEVLVRNDSVYGISSSELNTGGDKIELAPRYGETATQRRITKPLIQDVGMLKLEVR